MGITAVDLYSYQKFIRHQFFLQDLQILDQLQENIAYWKIQKND